MHDIIVKGNKQVRFKISLVGFTGLPNSGRTTLVKNIISDEVDPKMGTQQQYLSVTTYQIGVPLIPHYNLPDSKFAELSTEDIHVYMLACAIIDDTKKDTQKYPALREWSDSQDLVSFKSDHIHSHFKQVYNKVRLFLSENPHIPDPMTLMILNIWDIGINKALYESLPLLARLASPLVLVNLLDLSRDSGPHLREPPDLKQQQFVMRFRSRCHYFVRIAGLCKHESKSILVATHKDKLSDQELCKLKKLTEASIHAKAIDMGLSSNLDSEILTINATDDEDCKTVKQVLTNTVRSSKASEKDLHLTWIFLRTALLKYEAHESNFRMPFSEFQKLALQCGLKSDKEMKDFLQFFTQTGSLLFQEHFFGDNVIFDLRNFFQDLNNLYTYEEDYQTSMSKGILCKKRAKELWKRDSQFFWNVLQRAGVATETRKMGGCGPDYDYDITCQCCGKKECLFIPSIRRKHKKQDKKAHSNSLFIFFNNEYVPTDIQALFVHKLKLAIPEAKLIETEEYNTTKLEFPSKMANITESLEITVHKDVVEIMTSARNSDILGKLKSLSVKVLDAMIVYFPGFEYSLCFMCANGHANNSAAKKIHYLKFLPTQYDTKLYCMYCHGMVHLSPEQQKWMASTYTVSETVCKLN